MTSNGKKPVFIVGCARSGTTWLYHLLLSSGGFAIYRTESQIYNRFAPCFGGFKSEQQRRRFLDSWLPSEFFLRSGLAVDSFQPTVLQHVHSPGDLQRILMNGICEEQAANRWAECTPDYALYIQQIKRDFPDALFIHLVRDGRDVALSLAKQSFIRPLPWNSNCPEIAAAAYWAWITKRVSAEAELLGKDLLTVHYEDLVVNPEKILSTIADFIGKPIDLRRIDAQSIGAILKPNTSFEDLTGQAEVVWTPRWRSICDTKVLQAIEDTIGPGLQQFGYQRSSEMPERFSQLASIIRRKAYFSRFGIALRLKQIKLLGRFMSHNLEADIGVDDSDDPTIRPRENLPIVRRLVKL